MGNTSQPIANEKKSSPHNWSSTTKPHMNTHDSEYMQIYINE